MKENGFSDSKIQTLVGWQSLDMVRRYDDHTAEQELEAAMDEFAAVFGVNGDKNI